MTGAAEKWFGGIFLASIAAMSVWTMAGWPLGGHGVLFALGAGVVLFGLPHGALDPEVAYLAFRHRTGYRWQLFALVYSLIGIAYGYLWWQWPSAVLSSFLCISAIHFGSDWNGRGTWWSRLAYGCAVVTLPAMFHANEVTRIYAALGATDYAGILGVSRLLGCAALPIALAGALRQRRRDLVELLAITVGGLVLEPLVFFICYFCFLHSPRHLLETARKTGLGDWKAIGKAAAPSLLGALGGGLVFGAMMPSAGADERLLRVVFIGLAALTLPHMILGAVAGRVGRQQMAVIREPAEALARGRS
jgi:Brp/Blh family beta-carotene 15,15'-monooxygenase